MVRLNQRQRATLALVTAPETVNVVTLTRREPDVKVVLNNTPATDHEYLLDQRGNIRARPLITRRRLRLRPMITETEKTPQNA